MSGTRQRLDFVECRLLLGKEKSPWETSLCNLFSYFVRKLYQVIKMCGIVFGILSRAPYVWKLDPGIHM